MATINVYKTYSFVNKDPVIDKLRTMIADEGATFSGIHNASNVSTSCLHGWFHGKTRRPQHSTIMAVAGALGYEQRFVRISNTPKPKKKKAPRHKRR